jgi:hypothetical protein
VGGEGNQQDLSRSDSRGEGKDLRWLVLSLYRK